ncbi:PTS system, glucitol/sorbitol-specific IIA component [Salmonella enterica subsp. salamae]|uniref:PTS system, glucitol/sorbitol-specific IIA component n=1 Tax=Salmonella enterica subsp. salamae TaxID=59202 RepID=A0A6D2G7K1_SALER|nr:PTS system, glucitol/sorbitol-specific IIA component [Salmonella enterica subsp. salamae]
MSVIYQTTITRIGQSATEALSEQMLITFREGAPADIEEFCFIHCHGELTGALQPGARCELGQHCYPVTAVGSVAEQNLRELGAYHFALRWSARSGISRHRARCGASTGRYRAGLYFDVCRLRRKT